jgi:hypothetical protein
VFSVVPWKFLKRSVAEAFQEQRWPRDVEGGLSIIGLFEYFQLWDIIQDFLLTTMKTYTVGGLRALDFSHPDQRIGLSLMGRSLLSHGGTSRNLGPRPSVKFFFGWLFETDVGQRIVWPNEICRIRVFARCVIKQKKPEPPVSSHVNSGSEFCHQ